MCFCKTWPTPCPQQRIGSKWAGSKHWVMQQGFVHLDSERPVQNFIDHFSFWWIWRLWLVHEGFSMFFFISYGPMYNALQNWSENPKWPQTPAPLSDPRNFGRSLILYIKSPQSIQDMLFSRESSSPTPPTPREPTDPLNRVDRSPQTDMRNTCAKMINKELVDAGEQSSTFAENRGNPMEFERIPGFRPPSPPIGFPNLIFKARSESTILLGTYKTL